ncbi:DUF11 domain-containing protein [Erythrobacter donghaensis]|uniref:DUF11 domain-containing protein n=1 Tax=Erythrobacter donghaensis TaxID=267135 RepID=UPI000A3D0A47|nr:DUF11 domain-containing protein [Erythrobacter donghaensis]
MKTTKQLLGAVSAFALVAMTSAPALAQGTSAGTEITNTVNVTFNVNGVTQNAETATDVFTVDQRVNVTVTNVGAATSVAPGETDQALAFDVTNLSNSSVDLELTALLNAGTAANISNIRVYLDTNGDRVLDATELAAGPITYLDEVGSSATGVTVAVIVLADFGLNAVNGDSFDVALTANAHAAGGAGSLGAELVESATNTTGIDTVLFDGQGATDALRDGAFSAIGTYTVAGAVVDVAKASRVVSDPVNGTNNPKAIPGATVEYCITVSNATGAATATDVDVTDDLPFDVTYDSAFGIFVDGDATCANGTAGGTFTANAGVGGEDRVSGDLSDVAGGQTRSLYFRVTID